MTTVKRLRASLVCEAEGHLLVVRLRDPVTGFEALFPPGGGVEPGEMPADTARRETLEETGQHVRVDSEVKLVTSYPFRWAGVDYEVTTHFFNGLLEEAFDLTLPEVIDAPENLGACWLPVNEALDAMAVYPSIASAAAEVLRLAKRAVWQEHPNVAGAALAMLSIHDHFRLASERLSLLAHAEGEVDFAQIASLFAPLALTLRHHHQAEEATLFPLVQLRTGTAPERLVTEHKALMTAIAAVEENLGAGTDGEPTKAAIASFHEVLIGHLAREELLVVPVLLEDG